MNKFIMSLLVVAVVLPTGVFAQTSTADQIAKLQAQIVALTAQLKALQSNQEATSWCHDFNINMGIGHKGDEVTALRIALSNEGLFPDMGGGEDNFQELMASFVTGFQEKYRAEILTPNGLKYGTGFVGKSTRAKLNTLYGCTNTTPTSTDQKLKIPVITSISPTHGVEGVTVVTITGKNFSFSSPTTSQVPIVWMSTKGVYNVSTVPTEFSDTSIIFTVPKYAFPLGAADISVKTPAGESTFVPFILDTSTSSTPIITSIIPTTASVGSTLTINGVRFADNSNSVELVTAEVYMNGYWAGTVYPSTDGSKISFLVPQQIYPTKPCKMCTVVNNPIPVTTGEYKISVSNAFGASNSLEIKILDSTTTKNLTILSPNGGENWTMDSNQKITWAGVSDMFTIKLISYVPPCVKGTVCALRPISTYTIAKGVASFSYNWQVGANQEGAKVYAGQYQIQICSYTYPTICDTSDSYFNIISETISKNNAPEIVGGTSYAGTIIPGKLIDFNWSAKDADNDDLSWSITWGDTEGYFSATRDCAQNGKGWNTKASHAFTKAGTYKVVATVNDCVGANATSVQYVTVNAK